FFQAEDGIRDLIVTGVQTCALPILDDPATVLPGDPLGRTPGTPLTPPGTRIKQTIGGNPNLSAEVAYEWTYGIVWTPAKFIKGRSEEHTSELQSRSDLVCRLLLEKK